MSSTKPESVGITSDSKISIGLIIAIITLLLSNVGQWTKSYYDQGANSQKIDALTKAVDEQKGDLKDLIIQNEAQVANKYTAQDAVRDLAIRDQANNSLSQRFLDMTNALTTDKIDRIQQNAALQNQVNTLDNRIKDLENKSIKP